MQKNCFRALALVLVGLSPANASNGLSVTAEVQSHCEIDLGTQTLVDLTGYAVNQFRSSPFEYHCNFAGAPTFIVQSANGGVRNSTHVANYGIWLNDNPPPGFLSSPSFWLQASSAKVAPVPLVGVSFSSTPGLHKFPVFYVGLTQPLTLGGNYQDTLTITILP